MLTGRDNPEKVWNFLKSKGFNDYGAAGLMGNLHAESAIQPTNLQNSANNLRKITDAQYVQIVDTDDRTYTCEYNGKTYYGREAAIYDRHGFGLAQWTYWSRKKALFEYAIKFKTSVADLEMQLNYLVTELRQYGLLDRVKNATSVYEASTIILLDFEKPADKSEEAKKRRARQGQTYYDRFADPLESDLAILQKHGVTNTPAYWQQTAPRVQYLPELIHNMAEALK